MIEGLRLKSINSFSPILDIISEILISDNNATNLPDNNPNILFPGYVELTRYLISGLTLGHIFYPSVTSALRFISNELNLCNLEALVNAQGLDNLRIINDLFELLLNL